jgi:hypothetical protein
MMPIGRGVCVRTPVAPMSTIAAASGRRQLEVVM